MESYLNDKVITKEELAKIRKMVDKNAPVGTIAKSIGVHPRRIQRMLISQYRLVLEKRTLLTPMDAEA
jgi:IS30 family transposase